MTILLKANPFQQHLNLTCLELVDGIEPPSDDYKSTVLPLYYTSMLWL